MCRDGEVHGRGGEAEAPEEVHPHDGGAESALRGLQERDRQPPRGLAHNQLHRAEGGEPS